MKWPSRRFWDRIGFGTNGTDDDFEVEVELGPLVGIIACAGFVIFSLIRACTDL